MARPVAQLILTTHWDREWVQSFEQYRFRLVNLVENLLAILRAEPDLRFVFDGQTVVLEDYLEVCPQRRGELEALGRAGRLVVGPWYVLADQFLQGPEATVRNLQTGLRLAEAFGGGMRHGYVPDSFGSLATLPAILNGFSIRSANFGRGRAHLADRSAPLFRWAWRDGSEVLALTRGYANALPLSYPDIWRNIADTGPDAEVARATARRLVERDGPAYPIGLFYWSAGVDHMELPAGMSAIVEAINADGAVQVAVSDPARYMAAAEAELARAGATLERAIGEMRGDEASPMSLQGVYSTNLPIKQANRRCERLMAGVLEPLAVLSAARGEPVGHFLEHLWRLVLRNHPHDSICACSLDRVIRDMAGRYDAVTEQGTLLAERTLRRLVGSEPSTTAQPDYRPAVTLVNTVPGRGAWPFAATVRVPRSLEGEAFALLDPAGRRVGQATVLARKNQDLESFYAANDDLARMLSKTPKGDREAGQVYALLAAEGVADFGPAAGAQTLTLAPEPAKVAEGDLRVTGRSIANGLVELRFAEDGTFTLRDGATGADWTGLGGFEDTADIGNTYDFLPLDGDGPLRTRGGGAAKFRPLSAGPDRAEIEVTVELPLPATSSARGRSRRLIRHRLVSTYTLYPGCRVVHVRTAFENRATDHRLRLSLEFGDRPALTTGTHFAALGRDWTGRGDRYSMLPLLDWLHLRRERAGLAVLVRGLYELEAQSDGPGGRLLVTLCRSVRQIGAGAGANYAVQHARELGPREVEYALAPVGDLTASARLASAYTTPVVAEAHGLDSRAALALPRDLLALEGEGLVLSCLKPAQHQAGFVVRFYNLFEVPTTARLRLGLRHGPVSRVDLEERPLPDRPAPQADGDAWTVPVGPCEIVTLHVGP